MQPRERALHHDEARAGDLRRGVEVEHAEPRADVDVVLHREVERARRAAACALRRCPPPTCPPARDSCGTFGMTREERLQLRPGCPRAPARARRGCALTCASAISGDASSPFALAWPICFESWLRLACSSCVSVCIACARPRGEEVARGRARTRAPRGARPRRSRSLRRELDVEHLRFLRLLELLADLRLPARAGRLVDSGLHAFRQVALAGRVGVGLVVRVAVVACRSRAAS